MGKKRTPTKQAELKANYKKLRDAGYSSKEASRLRSASPNTIKQALSTKPDTFRTKKPVSEKHAKAGGGSGSRYKKKDTYRPAPPMEYKEHKGRIKTSDYEVSTLYKNELAYKMAYLTVDKDGVETWKYFTILPDDPMTKAQLKDFVWQHCKEAGNVSYYQAKVKKGSIIMIGAYRNPEF